MKRFTQNKSYIVILLMMAVVPLTCIGADAGTDTERRMFSSSDESSSAREREASSSTRTVPVRRQKRSWGDLWGEFVSLGKQTVKQAAQPFVDAGKRIKDDVTHAAVSTRNRVVNARDRAVRRARNTRDRTLSRMRQGRDRFINSVDNTRRRVRRAVDNTVDRVEYTIDETGRRIEYAVDETGRRIDRAVDNTINRVENTVDGVFRAGSDLNYALKQSATELLVGPDGYYYDADGMRVHNPVRNGDMMINENLTQKERQQYSKAATAQERIQFVELAKSRMSQSDKEKYKVFEDQEKVRQYIAADIKLFKHVSHYLIPAEQEPYRAAMEKQRRSYGRGPDYLPYSNMSFGQKRDFDDAAAERATFENKAVGRMERSAKDTYDELVSTRNLYSHGQNVDRHMSRVAPTNVWHAPAMVSAPQPPVTTMASSVTPVAQTVAPQSSSPAVAALSTPTQPVVAPSPAVSTPAPSAPVAPTPAPVAVTTPVPSIIPTVTATTPATTTGTPAAKNRWQVVRRRSSSTTALNSSLGY